ncbi:potassium transporter [Metschnikowia bicuspidata var. bicuspidata NRRL YB-4993]|uniref:Potassium transporter n=1 Tax=Metschnikowia bicuspidata var. bicuspidata NRRL YB-4993 TaxID=869754 RepID=A0A1A0HL14_9ASCO|nr:potassium transporter [Metschnikowia bicuspidata var. bicuspidata NRRL YB-4993]OBA24498.1 potassium transporter [Metschnikowia bicuspidata var. bicuspidata NRRL YB-4993]
MMAENTEPAKTEDKEETEFSELETVDRISTQHSIKNTLMLAYSSLGAIYGDIGTSPLYVLSSIKYPNDVPAQDDIYGAISAIFYFFIIIVLVKYALIVLTYGPNEGEGGQVAIYAKLARSLRTGPKGVIIPGTPERSDAELLKRTETTTSFISSNKAPESWVKKPAVVQKVSLISLFGCFLGCSLVFSDGLLTPTTSVLSAIAGIQVAKPDFDYVLVVSEIVIIFLFSIQQLGSHRISHLFAPIITLWLGGLIICGIINITQHPAIFRALSPYYAIKLFKNVGIDALGGVMLAITGTEAMFADLGHFGRAPTQIGISCVFISLIITYLGQGAYLVNHPENLSNVFYLSIPGNTGSSQYWVMFVLATLSTIIASQALILGVFSILAQLINLDCFPKLKIKHVSASYVGKVYIPVANILLLIGVCATTAGFKNSNRVTAAYGLSISLDFLVTSILMMICMTYVYECKWYVTALFGLIFVPLELCLVIANMKKVPRGAWFPLMMCAIFLSFLLFWRYCRDRTVSKQLSSRVRLTDLYPDYMINDVVDLRDHTLKGSDEATPSLTDIDHTSNPIDLYQKVRTRFGVMKRNLMPGACVIYSDTPHQDIVSPNTVPQVYAKIINYFGSIPALVVFCRIRVLSIPTVPSEERIVASATKIPGHLKCVIRFGFMEEAQINEEIGTQILDEFITIEHLQNYENSKIPLLHVFERNEIRAKEYGVDQQTKNPLILVSRFVRQLLINHVFGPIDAVFQHNDRCVSWPNQGDDGEKIFIGGTTVI